MWWEVTASRLVQPDGTELSLERMNKNFQGHRGVSIKRSESIWNDGRKANCVPCIVLISTFKILIITTTRFFFKKMKLGHRMVKLLAPELVELGFKPDAWPQKLCNTRSSVLQNSKWLCEGGWEIQLKD